MTEAEALVLVTGASSGIGRALAVELAAGTAPLLLQGRDPGRLQEVLDEVTSRGGRGRVVAGDLTEDATVQHVTELVTDCGAGLAALVHSAGMVRLGAVAETDAAVLDAHFRLNVRAPYALTRALLPALAAARGQVVFVNSGAGLHARAGWSAYAASKFALRAVADSLRQEVASHGIRVTTVYPGRTATPMQREVRRQEGRDYDPEDYVHPREVARQIAAALAVEPPGVVVEVTIASL